MWPYLYLILSIYLIMTENVKSSMVQRCSMAYDLIAPLLNILNVEKGQLNYNLDAMFLHL